MAIFRPIFVQVFRDQPEDGPTIGPKHVAGIVI